MSFFPRQESTGQKNQDYHSSSPYYNHSSQDNVESDTAYRQPPKDYETDPAPQSSSNTYHTTQSENLNWQLPPGWKLAYRENDGRPYYFELATGKTSWNHPHAPPDTEQKGKRNMYGGVGMETPATAAKRPDSHQCCALFSCVVFPPLGIFALVHSTLTYRAWSKGKYGDAYDHSRQAYNFAWWAVAIFLGFVTYHFFFGGGPGWDGIKNLFNFN